jgi:hypothetical protein
MIVEPREKQCPTVQKLGLNVKKLEEVTMEAMSNWFNDKDHPENANKRPFLKEIFKIAKAEERYKNGEIGEFDFPLAGNMNFEAYLSNRWDYCDPGNVW